MIVEIKIDNDLKKIDLSKPIDISIPIDVSKQNVNAWYVDEPKIVPVTSEDWVGSVAQGADVNFNKVVSAEPREIDSSSSGFS